MCIYCGTNKYRKIYEQHFGTIPKDADGRSYHIHHIDGNRTNNIPENLKAVSIQEHYNIHYSQGDFGAACKLSRLLDISAEEIHNLSVMNGKMTNKKRLDNKTHHFLKENGGSEIGRNTQKRLVLEGKHNFLGTSEIAKIRQLNRSKNGTHTWLGGNIQRMTNKRLLEEGKHHSQIKVTCPHCGKIGSLSVMHRWHFNKCRTLTQVT